jgi:cytochrome b
MKRILVWDIPVRLFHWLLAGSFLGAFAIANLVDDESSLFTVHMFLGGVVAFMILLRVVWGFVGSRYARFGSFTLNPKALVVYLKGALTGKGKRYAGHNPATSITAIAMFIMLLGLATTGAFMSTGGEAFEEIHEVLAWGMLAAVVAHVAGIILHTISHRENIALSMVHGRKEVGDGEALRTAHPAVAVVFLVLTGLWSWGLVSNYDNGTMSLPLTDQTFTVGEGEEQGEHGEHEENEENEEHEEHEEHEQND